MLKGYRLLIFLFVFLLFGLFIGLPAYSQEKAPVYVIEVDGIINPATSKFITESIDQATEKGAQCLIIQLDTPGGLMESMRLIIKKIMTSAIPVIVYVSPSGGRAASAGVFITMAAHIAVMAPGTHIGAAHPVSFGEGKESKTMGEKIVNDTVSYIKTIAKTRGRNVDWGEKAVRKSVSITEEEAVKLNVVDFISPDIQDLLSKIDGKVVKFDGVTRTLLTKGVKPRSLEMSWRYRFLDIISNPSIAYILLMLGIYGIFFELSNPGAILPGSRRRDIPHPCLLCPADASHQFCRSGAHSLRHDPLHCGDQGGEPWPAGCRRGDLSLSGVSDVNRFSHRIYEDFFECNHSGSFGQRRLLHFCGNKGDQRTPDQTDHWKGGNHRGNRNRCGQSRPGRKGLNSRRILECYGRSTR